VVVAVLVVLVVAVVVVLWVFGLSACHLAWGAAFLSTGLGPYRRAFF
jgi:hypothetical protein